MPHFPNSQELSDMHRPHMIPEEGSYGQIETENARIARLQIKTRRRRYLELHPEYFTDSSLELAGLSHLP